MLELWHQTGAMHSREAGAVVEVDPTCQRLSVMGIVAASAFCYFSQRPLFVGLCVLPLPYLHSAPAPSALLSSYHHSAPSPSALSGPCHRHEDCHWNYGPGAGCVFFF
jgi:hypothetical protein